MSSFMPLDAIDYEQMFDKGFLFHDKRSDTSPHILENGQIEERVKVDRKKFEQMIHGENAETGPAEEFFKRIMRKTNATVSWPPQLKAGTKSKKDPHIRITGTSEEIAAAKQDVLFYLDGRRNRVTLKMDVAFTDHSHIIGKGGRSIQKVMDDTGCHIHFPDSNRTNILEKSNQVSIAGTTSGSEQARCRIRELLPLTIVMDLPVTAVTSNSFDISSPAIQSIQQTYGVAVSIRFSSRQTLAGNGSNFITVSVRGTRGQVLALRQGVMVLVEYLVGTNMPSIPMTVCIEIAAQHHSFVMGRGECNVKAIMQQTGAVITFPDNSANDLPLAANSNRKSTVIIRGRTFDSVFLAWQELLACLPLVLIFDLREGHELDSAQITQLMDQLKVSILIKPKQKQNMKSIMVRGQERDSRILFEVRRQILGLDQSEVPVCCDQHAWVLASKLISMFLPYCGVPGVQQTNPFVQMPLAIPPGFSGLQPKNMLPPPNPLYLKSLNQVIPSSNVQQPKKQIEPLKSDTPLANPYTMNKSPMSYSSSGTPASNATPESASSVEISTPLNQMWPSSIARDYDEQKLWSLRAVREKPSASEVRTPTAAWSGLGFSKTIPSNMFKDHLIAGSKFAGEAPSQKFTESTGFPSKSKFWESEKFNGQSNEFLIETDTKRENAFSQSNYFDGAVNLGRFDLPESHFNSPYSSANTAIEKIPEMDLSTVLSELGASKYVDLFEQHNLDFKTFLTLNDADLQELGIAYFGRQKLMSIILDLTRCIGINSSISRFNAAPGAERRRRANHVLPN